MTRIPALALVLLALALPASAQQAAPPQSPQAQPAGNVLDQVAQRGVLRVGTTGDYKPFTYLNPETKQFEGIDIEMAKSLGKALGAKVEFVKTSWPTLMADFGEGKFDIAMGGISVNLDRQKKALFTQPYLVDGKAPIGRCADKEKFKELSDIDKPGVRVIVNPGGTNERFAKENIHSATVTVFPDNVTIFDQIAEGKADIMITDASETLMQQKLHPGQLCSLRPDRPFNYSEKAYLLPRDMLFTAFVDQWLHLAVKSKEYQAISDKWFK
jgi:cyclohexadienyl dehydratase